jgi:hypothetical protein
VVVESQIVIKNINHKYHIMNILCNTIKYNQKVKH